MLQKTDAAKAAMSRVVALDVLRGMAILGTFATNVGIFTAAAMDNREARAGLAEPSAFDHWISTAISLVTDGKWIGLLTIMFGIGLEIQRQSAIRKGETWLGAYPWRAAILILDGLLNYIFIFEFDVLMGYGITGLVVCAVLVTSPKVQAWVMAIGVTVHVGLLLWIDGFLRPPDGRGRDVLIEEAARRSDFVLADPRVGGETDTVDQFTYWSGVQVRWETFWQGGRAEIGTMILMGLGLFLVGAFLYRRGIFEASAGKLRAWVMGLSFGVALPFDWCTRVFFPGTLPSLNRYFTSACVSIGLLALVAHFYARGRQTGLVGRALGRVGRMALTCYISQNLIASVLFYQWGLNLSRYLNFGVWNEVVAFLAVAAILVAFSTLWLRFFARGPVEWLWHWMYLRCVRLTAPLVRRWHAKRGRTVAIPGVSSSTTVPVTQP